MTRASIRTLVAGLALSALAAGSGVAGIAASAGAARPPSLIAMASRGGPATGSARPAPGFPVRVTTAGGSTEIASRPKRILCLSASSTQMLYAIGAGRQVVGVDKYSTYPPYAPRTTFTGYETSAEDYLPLHPDLVILAFDENHMVAQLKLLGIPTLVLPPATTLVSAYQQMVELGEATGHVGAARAETASLERDLSSIVRSADGVGRGDTYYVELDPTLYSATSATFIGAVLARFGMVDIANSAGHGSAYPQLSAEYLLKKNPDYVFLADTVCCGQTPASFAKRPGFSVLRAIRLHHVIGVNDSYASEWGPHSLEVFARIVAGVLRRGSRIIDKSHAIRGRQPKVGSRPSGTASR